MSKGLFVIELKDKQSHVKGYLRGMLRVDNVSEATHYATEEEAVVACNKANAVFIIPPKHALGVVMDRRAWRAMLAVADYD
jgi:hypothetical protein